MLAPSPALLLLRSVLDSIARFIHPPIPAKQSIQALRQACAKVIETVRERRSRSGWEANAVSVAEDKGAATALQNYAYKKIWMSPWVRALTEIAQNSLDAGADELRLVLLECNSLEPERNAETDPLLLTYAADNGKGLLLDSFIGWFQQYGGSGKRSASGSSSSSSSATAGGLGDGNTFLVHGARRTVARSANFLSVIEGKTAVHLCAGCGFILPRTQVKYDDVWREVSLPCLRRGCALRLVDGMEAVAQCPQECGAHDLFPELGNLVRRVHATAIWRDPPLPDAAEPDAAEPDAAKPDAAEALVCTRCLGFHARAPLPPERAPKHPQFARGLELLVEHVPEALRDSGRSWSAFVTLKDARSSWMQFMPSCLRTALRLRCAAVRTEDSYLYVSAVLPLREDEMAGIYDDSRMLMLDCVSESCSGAALLDYPAAATLASVWESPKIKEASAEQFTWVELSEATAHSGDVDTYYMHVLMNGLLVHRVPLYGNQPLPLVLSLTSNAPPSAYTTSNRGSIEGPLKPLIADIVSEIKYGKLQRPENFFLLSPQDVLAAPAAEPEPEPAAAAAPESAGSSALAGMVQERAREGEARLARAQRAKAAYRASLLSDLREAQRTSARQVLAGLLRESTAFASQGGYAEVTNAAELLADIQARVRPALLSTILRAQPSRALPRLSHSVCAEDAWVSASLDALEADLAAGFSSSAGYKLDALLACKDLSTDSVAADRRLLAVVQWTPTYLVNGQDAELPRGLSYGHLSDGAVFALSVFGRALRELHTAALKNSRINWKVPESFCEAHAPPVGLLIQAQGYVASRGGRIVGAEDQRSRRGTLAAAALKASTTDSHLMACLHMSSKTFFVDAGYVLSNQARYVLGVDPETELGSVYEETELDAEVCVALVLPLALHEFAHAITRSAEHDEDFASIMTILMTSAACEHTQERVLRYAQELRAQLQAQRAQLVQRLRSAAGTASARTKRALPAGEPSAAGSVAPQRSKRALPAGEPSAAPQRGKRARAGLAAAES